jgi:hypothetical protein
MFSTIGTHFPTTLAHTRSHQAIEDGSSGNGNLFPLVRDGAAFCYKGVEYCVKEISGDDVHAVVCYPFVNKGEQLGLDKATTQKAISASLTESSNSERYT